MVPIKNNLNLVYLIIVFLNREKKPEKKRRSLIRLGVSYDQSYAWSRSRMGGWAIAQSPILGTTITLDRLKKRGYLSLLEIYIRISPQLNEPLYTACPGFYREDPYVQWCERFSLLVFASGATYSITNRFSFI